MSGAFDFKSKLEHVKPAAPATPSARDEEAADQVAERNNFVSREPAQRLKRVRSTEPIDIISVKGPLSVMNRFKAFANGGHGSYWEAIDDLLRRAGH
jgi:hypothetical protein